MNYFSFTAAVQDLQDGLVDMSIGETFQSSREMKVATNPITSYYCLLRIS